MADLAALGGAGLDLVYAPGTGEMYPTGFATTVHVARSPRSTPRRASSPPPRLGRTRLIDNIAVAPP